MKSLFKNMLKIAGGIFAIALLVFTGMQSYQLLYDVSGSQITAVFGLFVFEFGMLFWWFEFQHGAEGILQLAISCLMFILSMLLVMMATGLHLGAFDAQMLGQSTPAKLITIAVIVNIVAKLMMPLVSPSMMQNIYTKVAEGMLLQKTFQQFTAKADGIAANLSDSMADTWTTELDTSFTNKYQNADGRAPVVIDQPAMSHGETTGVEHDEPGYPTMVNGQTRPQPKSFGFKKWHRPVQPSPQAPRQSLPQSPVTSQPTPPTPKPQPEPTQYAIFKNGEQVTAGTTQTDAEQRAEEMRSDDADRVSRSFTSGATWARVSDFSVRPIKAAATQD